MMKVIKKIEKIKRQPIVTIVGHIDHGKTTLLNYLRKKKEIEKEHGGITQYIKPYNIKTKYGNITFLDTPGHFAFNSIRKKSIRYSDIAILIIAADDGIKPQTIESIEIAKGYNIPIIIAINKIDKLEKKTEKIITELSKYDLTPEKWGGDTLISFISSKTGEGIDNLLELISLQAEILDLTGKINCQADGIILDNKIDVGKGPITTLIVLNGLLKKGDIIQIKDKQGKIRTITNDEYIEIDKSELSIPLYITGLSNSIEIGEKFVVIPNFTQIKLIQNKNQNIYDVKNLIKNFQNIEKKKINLIIKADVQGSINVLKEIINNLSAEKIIVTIVKIEMGNFNTSDIDLSLTTNSYLIGFNVKCDSKTKKMIENTSIKVSIFYVIYDLTDFVNSIIKDIISDENKENVIGIATVKKIFKQENISTIAGCIVTNGKMKQNSNIKIFRKNTLIHSGVIDSIKMFKNSIQEVKAGMECGILIKDFDNIQINDKIKAFFKASERI